MKFSRALPFLLLAALWSGTSPAEPLFIPRRVVFIGNSLTSANDLPAIFGRVAGITRHRIRTDSSLLNNYDLGLHLENRDTHKLFNRAIESK
jgi:hypothetical protein